MSFDVEDQNLTILLASGSGSLATAPGNNDNWIERAGGGLPPYVRKVARGVMKSGRSKSQAIAIAIGRIRKWAAGGGDVDADTKAKAQKALAQWEKLKAKNNAKQVVKATAPDGGVYLALAAGDVPGGSFEVDRVNRAWHSLQSAARDAFYEARRGEDRPSDGSPYKDSFPYLYIRSLWTDFIIVEHEQPGGPLLLKIPYTVSDTSVDFGQPVAVKQAFQEVTSLSNTDGWDPLWDEGLVLSSDEDNEPLTENEILLLKGQV